MNHTPTAEEKNAVKVLVSQETDDEVGADLLAALDGVEVIRYDPNSEQLTEQQRQAQILLPPYRSSHRPKRLFGQLSAPRMVQLLSAGADEWADTVPADVILASARGAHAGPVSEWALSAILTLYRQWPALVRFADQGIWAHRRFSADTLAGKKALVVGAGHIGTATARRLAAFDATTTLVASTARDGIHGPDELPSLLGQHDIVVITAPLTPQTEGMFDKELLAAMPDGALLVNAGRGRIVDTDALVTELQTQRLRAALDVTDPEPLPEQHPLWACPGIVISPHSARTVPGANKLCYEVAAKQVSTFLLGETPSNAVAERANSN
ncbi:NAD(P)-dependent oxidoreductase [Amycolatopsis sp. NPDC023774]|uniref:NAD(P)-dependent oxidoreductase n=1 Tax=Amycolatopsis sp. NPDC023774 TaxID=3155015 RepID=UPI003402902D